MRLCVLPNSRCSRFVKVAQTWNGRGPGTVSSKGGCARSAKIAQTWNGKRPWSGLQQGWACQACQNRADLERHHAIDAAPEGGCARSDKTTQTWNGTMPWRRLYEGQVNFFFTFPNGSATNYFLSLQALTFPD